MFFQWKLLTSYFLLINVRVIHHSELYKGLHLFGCTHNINKTSCFYLEQKRLTKMNRKTSNTCLTDLINIYLERFKLIINKINKTKTKTL